MKSLCLLLLFSLLLARVEAAEELGPLLDKMAVAYGGRDRLEKLVAFTQNGQVTAATSIGNSGPLVRTFARPLKLRVQIGDPAHPAELRVLDGTNGWRNGKSVTGASYQAMVLQAVRLDLPFQLLSNKAKLVEKEPSQFHDHKVRTIELPLDNGLAMTAGIDPETGRILLSTGQTAAGPMGRLSFQTEYDDFQTVDNVLFAWKETNVANDTKTADIAFSVIQLLKETPRDAFKP